MGIDVVLGEGPNQFFIRSGTDLTGTDYCWSNLCPLLNDRLINYARNTENLARVALGPSNDWLLYDQAGDAHWSLGPSNQRLLNLLGNWKGNKGTKKDKGAIKVNSL